jgi:hypothetical protein
VAASLKNPRLSRAGYITFIGSINDTPAIDGGEKYFQSDQYAYKWTDRNGEHEERSAVDVLRSSGFNPTSPYTSRKRVESVVYVNVKTDVPDWLGAAGKTHMNQLPYATTIAKTLVSMAHKISSYHGHGFALPPTPSSITNQKTATDYVDELLIQRRKDIEADPDSRITDRLTQRGVAYRLRPKMQDDEFDPKTGWATTMSYITNMINDRCKKIWPNEDIEREYLGIYAKARGMFYYRGRTTPIDFYIIGELASEAAVNIVVEKEGIPAVLEPFADKYRVALISTQGHFADYVKRFISSVVLQKTVVVTILDDDIAGTDQNMLLKTHFLTEIESGSVSQTEAKSGWPSSTFHWSGPRLPINCQSHDGLDVTPHDNDGPICTEKIDDIRQDNEMIQPISLRSEFLPSQLPTFPALPKNQFLTSFGSTYPLEKSLTTTSGGESQNNQWEEKAEAELDGIQLFSSPYPDDYMTGKFTTEYYLTDLDGNYGQVKLEIHKRSAEKVSFYEAGEYFSLANIKNSPAMVLVAAMTAIVATAKLRKIFTSSQKQLVIIKERSSILQQQRSPILLSPQQPQSFTHLPIPASLVEKVPALGRFAVFDSEWHFDNPQNGVIGDIYTFCLVDDHGRIERLHINNFPNRREFMSTILDILGRYDTLAGYLILNNKKGGKEIFSDKDHIINNCKRVGLDDKLDTIECNVLDVYKIYQNETVDGLLKLAYNVSYRGESLDAVTKAFLGKGKPEGVSGINVEFLTPEQQLSYCLQDAQLCYELLQQRDFELLHILYEISQEIKLPFFETCNAQWPTKWWSSKLKSIGYQKVPSDVQQWIDDNTVLKTNGTKKGVVAMDFIRY